MEIEFLDEKIEGFIQSLEKVTIARVLHTLDLLEKFGHLLGLPHSKKVSDRLFELRIRGQQEVRLFYSFYKGKVVFVHGFIKKTQKIPQKELFLANKKLKSVDQL